MKRRDFVEKTLAGASGLAVAGFNVLPASCVGGNEKVVLALIGAGSRGRSTIINACKVNPLVEIKTVCDVNDLKAGMAIEAVQQELGYTPGHMRDIKEVLDDRDIDGVWIATPEHWHALATVWACQAGKDVYVEKNPTISIWEGRKMVEAAQRYKRVVQIGFQNRSAPYAVSARDFIKAGKLGKVMLLQCFNMLGGSRWEPQPDGEIPEGLNWDAWLGPAAYRPYNPGIHSMTSRGGWGNYWDFSGGVLSDDASHVVDLARMVIGDPGHPVSVYGWGGNYAWGSERETPEFQSITYDFGDFTMTCESGTATNYMAKTRAEIRNSSTQFPFWSQNATRTEIHGTEGIMYLGRHGGGWQVLGRDGEVLAQEFGLVPDTAHQINFIESMRAAREPNATVEQGHLSATLVHLGNIVYRVGNMQLFFDGQDERFTNSKEANKLVKTEYRTDYRISDAV